MTTSLKWKRVWVLALSGMLCGCHSVKVSEPPRTALEQLLLSSAADRAVVPVDLAWVKGLAIFVQDKYFESYDKGYAISLIRDRLSLAGGRLIKEEDKADYIVEIRSGGLGMNTSQTLFGIPSFALPIPFSGPIQTPELAFYKSQKADSTGKFALFAYKRDSGEHLESTGPMAGKAHFYFYKLFFVSWQRTDVTELQRQPKSVR